ncbi:hypothetical protein HOP60_10010 [Halomonas daqingensis]|uniref:Uncharacterized protein n=1 Tax=Billgrantia desiderata TaxID=52021 RepID=A0ABS9B581_9GAMM|nr:hypothetical protein [Halomonas desiderata]MCE8042488.1 hypothetical protein [Halomonas desiderata]MCE8047063.1 hypothetical protein [Halomonas desiderata]
MNYCPTCWPADLGEYEDGRCLDCGSQILAATPEKQIELLCEQNEALTLALQQAMEALGASELKQTHRPALRLVHSASKKNDKEPRS